MLHEWLHIVLAQERGLLANLLCKQDIACLYDASQLRKLGYLRGYTMHHHLHAMEECIVQGLTAHFAQSPIEAEAQISQLYNQGFYLSEKAWKCAQLLSPDQNNFQTYLTKLFLS